MPDANGGDTPNNSSQGESASANAPKYMTQEDVSKAVNAAITGHIGRFEKGLFAKLDERFASLSKPKVEDQKPEGESDPKAPKVDPEVVKLRREQEELRKEVAKERAEREQIAAKARHEKSRGDLRDAFASKVNKDHIHTLVKAYAADITYDDEGNALLDLGSGAMPIAAAVEEWSKSKFAAPYLPPPSSGGSGAGPARTNAGGNQYAAAFAAGKYEEIPHEVRLQMAADMAAGKLSLPKR